MTALNQPFKCHLALNKKIRVNDMGSRYANTKIFPFKFRPLIDQTRVIDYNVCLPKDYKSLK